MTKERVFMRDIKGSFEVDGVTYPIVFNLNVMQEIQEEYGTLEKWGDLTDGSDGEPNAKAVIFGFASMINEGIDIENENANEDRKPLTRKQVGRIITSYGLIEATKVMNDTVVESTKSTEKNA